MDQGGRRAKRAEANPGSSVRPVEPGGAWWSRGDGRKRLPLGAGIHAAEPG